MTIRFYSSIAQQTTLTGTYSPSSTVIAVAGTTGFPSTTPYTLALDYGQPNEELVDVTAVAGLSLTVTRAVDGTSATIHNAGAVVRHVSSARDFADSRNHENANTAVHGITGAVVGTTDTQTLTNKTLVNPTFNNPSITGTVSGAASYTGITLTNNPVVTGNMDVNGTAPGTAQLDVMAAAGQTAGIQRWLNSGGSTLASITGSGVVNAASGLTVTPSAVGNVASTVTGLASQTASLEQWKNSTGTVLAEITAAGRLNANTGATLVGDPSPSTGGVSIKAGPSSNNITEFHDAANALKANIDTNGALHAGGVTVPLDSSAANGGGIGNIQLNRASGSQNVTGTTLVDNTVGLTFDVLAGGTYKVEFRASFEGPSAAGVRAAWRQTGASANDLARFITAPGVTTTSVADGTFQGSQRGSATTVGVGISPTIGASLQEDFVYTATADTTWIFQFCQNTSNASPVTLSPVSYVLVTKIQGL